MSINIIVAMDRERAIGYQGKLPWSLPPDLKRFKEITTGHTIIMGRKTYESIGRPLPNRTNVIISRNPNFHAQDCVTISSLTEVLANVKDNDEVFVIGGSDIYKQALPYSQKIYMTLIDKVFKGDTFFPSLESNDWQETQRESYRSEGQDPFIYHFTIWQRKI